MMSAEHLCPICLDKAEDAVVGNNVPIMCSACGQSFCGGCWSALLKSGQSHRCPTCREPTRVTPEQHASRLMLMQRDRDTGRHTPRTQGALGSMYAQGFGVPQDLEKGLRLLGLAADGGDALAQYALGMRYKQGLGVEQDYAEAVRRLRIAAQQHYPSAQRALGSMYTEGIGVVQDYAEARRWLTRAADQGELKAIHNLGLMHFHGQGGAVDYAAAALCLKRAADKGSPKSIEDLPYILHLLFPPGTPIELVKMRAVPLNGVRGVVLGSPVDKARVGKLIIQIGDSTREVSFENLRRVGADAAGSTLA
jgi:TPR repeat protein